MCKCWQFGLPRAAIPDEVSPFFYPAHMRLWEGGRLTNAALRALPLSSAGRSCQRESALVTLFRCHVHIAVQRRSCCTCPARRGMNSPGRPPLLPSSTALGAASEGGSTGWGGGALPSSPRSPPAAAARAAAARLLPPPPGATRSPLRLTASSPARPSSAPPSPALMSGASTVGECACAAAGRRPPLCGAAARVAGVHSCGSTRLAGRSRRCWGGAAPCALSAGCVHRLPLFV